MGKTQTRRTVSLNGDFFAKLVAFCQAQGRAVSEFTERTLAEKMGMDKPEVIKPHPTFGVEVNQVWISKKGKRYRVHRIYQRPIASMCSLRLCDSMAATRQMTCQHLVERSGYKLDGKAPSTTIERISPPKNRVLLIADRARVNLRPPSPTTFVGSRPTPAPKTPVRDEVDPWSSIHVQKRSEV